MEDNKKKNILIVALILIIVLLVVLLYLVINKKSNEQVIYDDGVETQIINPEPDKIAPEDKTTIEETVQEGENTTTKVVTKLNESGVKKLHSTLITNVGGGYGLYFIGESNKISIDDVNNPYLIAFNLKKYLIQKLGYSEYGFKWPAEGTWTWDNCINNECEYTEDYTKLYRVSKKDFNDYMHTTYNTTNNYDLLKTDEGKTADIISSNVVIDSSSEYYNLLLVPKSGSEDKVRTSIEKYEEDENYLYIYDKFVFCSTGSGLNVCYPSANNTKTEEDAYITCTEERIKECDPSIDASYNDMVGQLTTFKHTFKKVDGNYYWISSEYFKGPNY